jgi:hypothetical protein
MTDPLRRNLDLPRGLSRREILRAGGLGLFGLTLSDLLAARASAATVGAGKSAGFGRAKSCILLFMWGAPAHQDTWDMKPDAPVEFRGQFKPIHTNVPGIQICQHFPELARRTDKLAIVRSMTHSNVDHTAATHYLLTGDAPVAGGRRMESPSIGSVLMKLGRGRGALPPAVTMRPKLENDVPRFVEQSQGQFAGWLGPVYDPFLIDQNPNQPGYHVGEFALGPELSISRLEERRSLLADVNRYFRDPPPAVEASDTNHQRAFELLASTAGGRGAFDLSDEPRALRERYGLNPHGQSVLQARRLVERGVPLVTVFWPSEGIKNVSVYWDTHSRNFIDLEQRLMPPSDQAFSALLDDLGSRGLLDETLVVWTGEFGRTPRVGQSVKGGAGAGRDGRDHWAGCFSSVLAGGGIRGGTVHGKSDRYAAYPAEDPVPPHDLVATVYHALGVPEGTVLYDAQKRPHNICSGRPIRSLLS